MTEDLVSGLSRNPSSNGGASEKHSQQLQSHPITLPLHLKSMSQPGYYANQHNNPFAAPEVHRSRGNLLNFGSQN
jgi:hypothetical protein